MYKVDDVLSQLNVYNKDIHGSGSLENDIPFNQTFVELLKYTKYIIVTIILQRLLIFKEYLFTKMLF